MEGNRVTYPKPRTLPTHSDSAPQRQLAGNLAANLIERGYTLCDRSGIPLATHGRGRPCYIGILLPKTRLQRWLSFLPSPLQGPQQNWLGEIHVEHVDRCTFWVNDREHFAAAQQLARELCEDFAGKNVRIVPTMRSSSNAARVSSDRAT